MKTTLTAIFAIGLALIFSGPVHADLITVPTDLSVGDVYHLAFVTSVTPDPTSTSISDYNKIVDDAANAIPALAALGVDWYVIGSTAAVDAKDNALVSAPVYNLNDQRVADGFADMWDWSIQNPINYTETGEVYTTNVYVWTGSEAIGTGRDNAELGYPGTVGGGIANHANPFWIQYNTYNPSDYDFHYYALSGPIEVVPVPGAVLLGILGLGAVGVKLRKFA